MRSSRTGTITVYVKACGAGALTIKSTPSYANEFKHRFGSRSALTIHLKPNHDGKRLLSEKRRLRVTIHLSLVATSGPQPGYVVRHRRTITIGVNASRAQEERAAANVQSQEERQALIEAEAAARATAAKDEGAASSDRTRAAGDESDASQLANESRGLYREAEEGRFNSEETLGDVTAEEALEQDELKAAETARQEAEDERDFSGQLEAEAAEDEQFALGEEELANFYSNEGNSMEAQNCENHAKAYDADAVADDKQASHERETAETFEAEVPGDELRAQDAASQAAAFKKEAKAEEEAVENEEAAAAKSKTGALEKEQQAATLVKLAEGLEHEASALRLEAEAAEKA